MPFNEQGDHFFAKKYIVLSALALYDAGLDFKEQGLQSRFFAINDIDTNNDGVIEKEDKAKAMQVIHDVAVNSGATTIPMSLCVDVTTGGKTASNDNITYYDKDVAFYYEDAVMDDEELFFLEGAGLVVAVSDENVPDMKVAVTDSLATLANIDGDEIAGGEIAHQMDVLIAGQGATIYVTVIEVIKQMQNLPFFSGFHLGMILQALGYAESFGLIDIEGYDKVAMANDISARMTSDGYPIQTLTV